MTRRSGLSLAFLCAVLTQPPSACWQVSYPPIKLANDRIKVKVSYMGKPQSDALVLLRNRKHSVSFQSKMDKDGWVSFRAIPPGDYKLILDGPSHESFDVVLYGSTGNAEAIFISF